jgi:hypothetical protein
MKRVGSLAFAVVVALAPLGCKKKEPEGPLRGSGVGAKVVRTTPPFSKLKVGGTVRVEVEVGKPPSVELLGDDNLLPKVSSRVDAGTLVIVPDGVLKPTQPLVARVTVPSLDEVELVVAATGFVRGVKAAHFVANLAGGASLDLDGSSQTVEVVTKAAAKADLRDFSVASAHVTTSEATRVELGHVETLEVHQKGPSLVTYQGSPEIKRSVLPPARLVRTGS